MNRRLTLLGMLAILMLSVGYAARMAEEALSDKPFNPVAFAAARYHAARTWIDTQMAPPGTNAIQLLSVGSTFTGSSSFTIENSAGYDMLSINGGNTAITVYGTSGKPIVVVHRDGHVDLTGNPNEAARVFWSAVGQVYPPQKQEPQP